MTTQIDTAMFNETEVIKSLRSKQVTDTTFGETKPLASQAYSAIADTCFASPKVSYSANADDNTVNEQPKSNRGRKRKYATDEERILARRAQQKAYRERKKKELLELRALKAAIESKNNSE